MLPSLSRPKTSHLTTHDQSALEKEWIGWGNQMFRNVILTVFPEFALTCIDSDVPTIPSVLHTVGVEGPPAYEHNWNHWYPRRNSGGMGASHISGGANDQGQRPGACFLRSLLCIAREDQEGLVYHGGRIQYAIGHSPVH